MLGTGFNMSQFVLMAWAMKNLGFSGRNPLVSENERNNLLKDFFEYLGRFPLPFVHEGYIVDKIRSGSPIHIGLLYSIFAVASCLAASPDGSKWPYFGAQSDKSQQFCGAALASLDLDNPTLESCQAIALVGVYLFLIGNYRSESQYTGMAFRMMSLLKLDVDPDILEAQHVLGNRKWTWLEKDTRRRIFAGMCAFDALDAMHNETSFGIWKHRRKVKGISTFDLWQSVDVKTGEPTINPLTTPSVDASICILSAVEILCKINELCSAVGASGNPISESSITVDIDPMLDREFNALDIELKTWLHVLPYELTPAYVENANVFAAGFDLRNRKYPFFGALRLHLYHYASELLLHRSRLLREFARMARSVDSKVVVEEGHEVVVPELQPAGRESLRRCVDACAAMLGLLRRQVYVVSPSPLPTDRSHPVAAFCSPIEARAILECGLHSIVMIALLEGPRGKKSASPPLSVTASDSEIDSSRRKQSLVDTRITSLITDYAGANALKDAKYALGVAATLLEQLSQRKSRVLVLSETLQRLIDQAGIKDLVKIDILGNATSPMSFEFDGLMM
ncbi:hypothetical protein HDU67_001205 [Dinochytrium kinnereticum]|nr:hypothetical protein HDU67_001205 [Dinochytrium kinnereticum]